MRSDTVQLLHGIRLAADLRFFHRYFETLHHTGFEMEVDEHITFLETKNARNNHRHCYKIKRIVLHS